MTEVLFYHLQNMSLDSVLPPLLEKSLERGWRVVVQSTSQERADALDAHLWTYRDDSFLPHATWRAGDAQDQPIILAVEEGNPNRANVRFLIDNALQCLAEYHIDGMRYDEVTVIDNNGGGGFCQELSAAVRSLNPRAIQIAEYWRDDRATAVRAVPSGLGFDAAWSDRLRDAIRAAIGQVSGGRAAFVDMEALARAFDTPAGFDAAWRVVNYIEDHDTVADGRQRRIASLADPSNSRSWFASSRARVAAGLLFAARGIPMLFMGQEILEDKQWSDYVFGRPDLLIAWDDLKTNKIMQDFLRFCRDLVALRRAQPAFRSESLRVSTRNNVDRIIALHRWIEGVGQDILVVANLRETNWFGYRIGFPNAGPWRELFNSDFYENLPNPNTAGNIGRVMTETIPWDGMQYSAAITLPANGFIVFAC